MEISYVLSKYASLTLSLLVVVNNGKSGILSGMYSCACLHRHIFSPHCLSDV